jgi:hypothetical protein
MYVLREPGLLTQGRGDLNFERVGVRPDNKEKYLCKRPLNFQDKGFHPFKATARDLIAG